MGVSEISEIKQAQAYTESRLYVEAVQGVASQKIHATVSAFDCTFLIPAEEPERVAQSKRVVVIALSVAFALRSLLLQKKET